MDDISKLQYYPANNTIGVTFKEGKAFADVYFSKGSAKLSPKPNPSEQGNLHEFELSWQNAGLNAPEAIILAEASEALMIFRIRDNNGSRIILPYTKIYFSQNIGQLHTNFTGVLIFGISILPHPAPMDMSLGTSIPAIV